MNNRFFIEISDRQRRVEVDTGPLEMAIRNILNEGRFDTAEISLAIVDDEEMHALNRQFLDHDYPTDVLSFPLSSSPDSLAGEIIVSIDTAERECRSHGLAADQELLLYVIHGMLHLVGYDDKNEDARKIMRAQEKYFMEKFGVDL